MSHKFGTLGHGFASVVVCVASAMFVGGSLLAVLTFIHDSTKQKTSKNTKDRQGQKGSTNTNDDCDNHEIILPSHLIRELYKEERREIQRHRLTMKKPMYDNILMTDTRGKEMCTISIKKANWYVKKCLAEWVTEVRPNEKIRLLFEPNVQGQKDPKLQQYNTSKKQNCCVVCGCHDKGYMRHYVVPYSYRTLFPEHYKTHLPHDIIILCPNCNVIAEQQRCQRMGQLEQEQRRKRKLHPTSAQAEIVNVSLKNVSSAANALLKWKDNLPESKIQEYNHLVGEWALSNGYSVLDNNNTPTREQLVSASELDCRSPNPHYVPGPDLVVDALKKSGSGNEFDELAITQFVHDWRRHFLNLHPKFLPKGWDVKAPVQSGLG